jgi:TonB family protein
VNRFALSLLRVWKRPLPEVLAAEIMNPIGASNTWRWHGYDNADVVVDGRTITSVPGGTRWGGGLWMSTRDHARFGYLMLRRGEWNGRRLLSESWIHEATTPGGLAGDYGYLWWLNTRQLTWPDAPASSFAAHGNGSNSIWIDRENDLVVVWRWYSSGENELYRQILESIVAGPGVRSTRRAPARTILKVGEDGVRIPTAIKRVTPVLPSGTESYGNVVVEVLISPTGAVEDVTLLAKARPEDTRVDEAVVLAASQNEYAPTVIDGVAYPVRLRIAYNMARLQRAR